MISIRLPENPEKALVFWAVVGVLVLILLILLFVLLSRKRKEAGRKQREELERSLKDALAEAAQEQERKSEESRREMDESLRRVDESVRQMMEDSRRAQQAQLDAMNGQLRAQQMERQEENAALSERMEERMRGFGEALEESDRRRTEQSEQEAKERREAEERIAGSLAAVESGQQEMARHMEAMIEERLHTIMERRLDASTSSLGGRLDEIAEGVEAIRGIAAAGSRELAAGRNLTGVYGTAELGALLADMLAPQQFEANAAVTPGGAPVADYVVVMPGAGDRESALLPIDASLPMREYEELCLLMESGTREEISGARNLLGAAVRMHARRVSEKLIAPPYTTDYAILFLPNEGLYAEVIRIPGLADRIRQECRMVPAGPTTFAALLSSLQLGFHSLAIAQQTERIELLLRAVRTGMNEYATALGRTQSRLQQAAQEIENAQRHGNEIRNQLSGLESLGAEESRKVLGAPPPEDDEDEWD
ncbi:MAG: DNA recombination protein RmuC [Clostridiales bacterium]|nr:DNA recombination protein RmuC [Clostridiales bacterium]